MAPMLPRRIETKRLIVRPRSVDAAGEMVDVLAPATLYEFTGGDPPTLESLEFLQRQQTSGSRDPVSSAAGVPR